MSRLKRYSCIVLPLALAGLLLSACQPFILPAYAQYPAPLLQTEIPSAGAATLAPSPSPSPTQTLTPSPTAPAAPTVTPLPDPLEFAFPTAAPAASSAWRPALYPVPWALTPYDHFYFNRPIAVDSVNWPLPDYRYGGVFFEDIVHSGVDYKVPLGIPILAAAGGKVIWAGPGLFTFSDDPDDPYGLAVLVRHDFTFQGKKLYTVYGHLSEVSVQKGDEVRSGDVLGLSGETGETTGPHLHFEVRLGEGDFLSTLNPELWLAPPQGWGVLAGRIMAKDDSLLEGQLVTIKSRQTGESWIANSYTEGAANSDPYYQENLVISDMPAGEYDIKIDFLGTRYLLPVTVQPGRVTYFTFSGRHGFSLSLPPIPGADFLPAFTP